MNQIAVLDACALVPYNLASLLLTLAEEGLFEPRWSERILDETERALVEKLGHPAERIARRVGAMRDAFPEAAVHGYEWLEPALTCHPKDRHVLAAAVAAKASAIVTFNLDDFPAETCDPHDIVVLHPEYFLCDLLTTHPTACAQAVMRDAAQRHQPAMTPAELLAAVTNSAPTFANTLHQIISDGIPAQSDVPAYVAAPIEDSPLQDYPTGFDPTDPLHVAFGWWRALLDLDRHRAVLDVLTHTPSAFGEYAWAADLLARRSIASRVYYAVDDPEHVAFIRFVPEVEQTVQAFAAFIVRGVAYMTLCRYPDQTWRVWGLGKVMVSARSVRT